MTHSHLRLTSGSRLRAGEDWFVQGFIGVSLMLSLVSILGCLFGGYWLVYSLRDALCKALTSTRPVEELAGVINRGTATPSIKQQLYEEGVQQQAYAEQVQSMIRKEQRQREEFWRKQREENLSCDAWMRTVVPCRLRPEASGGDTTTTGCGASTPRMPQ